MNRTKNVHYQKYFLGTEEMVLQEVHCGYIFGEIETSFTFLVL